MSQKEQRQQEFRHFWHHQKQTRVTLNPACLVSDLNWMGCAWSPTEWFDVSFSLISPTDEKQRDRVVRAAVLTAEGSRMTEPEASNSHYPSASAPLGGRKKKKKSNNFYATHVHYFHKQETDRNCVKKLGKLHAAHVCGMNKRNLGKKENVSNVRVPRVFREAQTTAWWVDI